MVSQNPKTPWLQKILGNREELFYNLIFQIEICLRRCSVQLVFHMLLLLRQNKKKRHTLIIPNYFLNKVTPGSQLSSTLKMDTPWRCSILLALRRADQLKLPNLQSCCSTEWVDQAMDGSSISFQAQARRNLRCLSNWLTWVTMSTWLTTLVFNTLKSTTFIAWMTKNSGKWTGPSMASTICQQQWLRFKSVMADIRLLTLATPKAQLRPLPVWPRSQNGMTRTSACQFWWAHALHQTKSTLMTFWLQRTLELSRRMISGCLLVPTGPKTRKRLSPQETKPWLIHCPQWSIYSTIQCKQFRLMVKPPLPIGSSATRMIGLTSKATPRATKRRNCWTLAWLKRQRWLCSLVSSMTLVHWPPRSKPIKTLALALWPIS